jgi:hypothetical protein
MSKRNNRNVINVQILLLVFKENSFVVRVPTFVRKLELIFHCYMITRMVLLYSDNDNDKPIKFLLKGKGLLPPVGLARLDS